MNDPLIENFKSQSFDSEGNYKFKTEPNRIISTKNNKVNLLDDYIELLSIKDQEIYLSKEEHNKVKHLIVDGYYKGFKIYYSTIKYHK